MTLGLVTTGCVDADAPVLFAGLPKRDGGLLGMGSGLQRELGLAQFPILLKRARWRDFFLHPLHPPARTAKNCFLIIYILTREAQPCH